MAIEITFAVFCIACAMSVMFISETWQDVFAFITRLEDNLIMNVQLEAPFCNK